MKIRALAAAAILGVLFMPLGGAESFWSDPAWQWGPRLFSRAEAEKISALAPEAPRSRAEARAFIQTQLPLLSGIILCERQGVRLSERDTLHSLKLELSAMPPAARREFDLVCRRLKLSPEELLRLRAQRADFQFQCAVREWYRRAYPGEQVSWEQVQDWYFRHQDRFLIREVKADSLWILPPDPETPARAAALLKQGVTSEAVRRKFPMTAAPEAVNALLESRGENDCPEKGFTLYRGREFQLLARSDAVQLSYRKLDPELAEAIQNALYDALAKARLAEALEKLAGGFELRFL